MSKSNRMPASDPTEEPIAGGALTPPSIAFQEHNLTKKTRERRSYAADLADLQRRVDMAVGFMEALNDIPWQEGGKKLFDKSLALLKGQ